MTHATAPTTGPARFRTIDGLRGIAAFSVAVFHFNDAIARSAPNWLPGWAAEIARHGYLGVEIFFVISGFVIAYSVRDGDYSPKYLGMFALRRSLRLDPPYWLAIAMELVLIVVSLSLFPSLNTPFPSTPKILSHLVYAQNFLGYGDILPIFWTLCYEIQFYVLFVGLLVLWQALERRLSTETRAGIAWAVLAALFISSLVLRYSGSTLFAPGLALQRWFQFFLGILTYWVVSRRVPMATLLVAYAAIIVSLVVYRTHADAWQLLPLATSAFIVTIGRRDALGTVLSARPLQFLGLTSYSLYLLHGPIAERWISLLQRVVGPSFGTMWAWIAFASATVISVFVAWLAWRFIESPTMNLSRKIRLPSRREPATKPIPATEAPATA